MHFRVHKKVNLFLTLVLGLYTFLAIGHVGHAHIYGHATPGFCTTQCENSEHFDTQPLCEGFPLNLTLGIIQDDLVADQRLPINSPEMLPSDHQGTTQQYTFTDKSRAPPSS
ncbi:MAG: hypothetical protein H8E26_03590 [FCB group bacterium]|nr:hypothetical protein [FCB group bacterium]MBL7028215.1 hypothetical protein [Candidatus Neomarinimicrobiota bacterium]MBL7122479.1 hypothetical protein [Candidatus Neomarinimicrobiota bacterium]